VTHPAVTVHDRQPLATWRPGVETRLWTGETLGARSLCIGEQWFQPGTQAPLHRHPGVEEIVTVLEGVAEFTLDGETIRVEGGASVLLPADSVHGFTNVGDGVLHVQGVYSSAAPATIYLDEPDVTLVIGGAHGDRVDATRVRATDAGEER
jgi:quercetin dioxygenase-like cupin family protein